MEELVYLNLIDPNPWQVREEDDKQHVWNVAQSIEAQGLMQIPAGRRVDGGRVQLAFGHTRLAAYKLLDEQRADKKYSQMPVIILEMTDQQMFERAVQENVSRKNLTPIEEALAMIRYRDTFGKTSEEIGRLFHMGDSGVRNKMRLLKLPADIKMCLRRGEMPEGVARELLALVELPEDVRQAAEDDDQFVKPSEIIEAAKSGSSQKAVAELVSKLMQHVGQRPVKALPAAPEPAPVAPPPLATFQPSRPASVTITDSTPPQRPSEQLVERAHEVARVFESQAESVSTETVQAGETFAMENEPPTPAPQEVAPETWETAEITLTLTWWPQDGNEEGRLIMAGAVAKGHAQPVFRMYRDGTLEMGETLRDQLEELKNKYFGGA